MPSASDTLQALCGAYYNAKFLSQGTMQKALDDFAAAKADPAFEPLARTKLADSKKVNAGGQRCIISATNVEFLTQALGG